MFVFRDGGNIIAWQAIRRVINLEALSIKKTQPRIGSDPKQPTGIFENSIDAITGEPVICGVLMGVMGLGIQRIDQNDKQEEDGYLPKRLQGFSIMGYVARFFVNRLTNSSIRLVATSSTVPFSSLILCPSVRSYSLI